MTMTVLVDLETCVQAEVYPKICKFAPPSRRDPWILQKERRNIFRAALGLAGAGRNWSCTPNDADAGAKALIRSILQRNFSQNNCRSLSLSIPSRCIIPLRFWECRQPRFSSILWFVLHLVDY